MGEVGAAAQTGIRFGNRVEFANHSTESQELSFCIKTATEKANKAQRLQRGSIAVEWLSFLVEAQDFTIRAWKIPLRDRASAFACIKLLLNINLKHLSDITFTTDNYKIYTCYPAVHGFLSESVCWKKQKNLNKTDPDTVQQVWMCIKQLHCLAAWMVMSACWSRLNYLNMLDVLFLFLFFFLQDHNGVETCGFEWNEYLNETFWIDCHENHCIYYVLLRVKCHQVKCGCF